MKTIEFYNKYGIVISDELMKEILNYYYIAQKRFDLQLSIIGRNMLVYIYNYLKENDKLYDCNLSITQEKLR